MKFKLLEDWGIFFIIFFIIIGTISGVKYFSSEQVFDAKILELNNEVTPYNVIAEISPKVSGNLEYEVEVIYKRGNLVSGFDTIKCSTKCEVKIELNKIFFDKYEIIIRTNYLGKFYEKKIPFIFEKTVPKFTVDIDKKVVWDVGNDLIVFGKIGTSIKKKKTKYALDVFPTKKPELKETFYRECTGSCEFNFILKSNIVFEEYTVNVYSQADVAQDTFVVVPFDQVENSTSTSTSDLNLNQKVHDEKDKKKLKKSEKKFESRDNSILVEDVSKRSKFKRTSKNKLKDNFYVDARTNIEGNKIEIDSKISNLNPSFKENGFGRVENVKLHPNGNLDLDIDLDGAGVEFLDVNTDKISSFKVYDDNASGSDIFFADVIDNDFAGAKVILRKDSGFVGSIRVCDNFSTIDEYNLKVNVSDGDELLSEGDVGFTNKLCESGWRDSGYDYQENETHVWFWVTHFSAYTAKITILNPQSYPVVNGLWTVEFNSSGYGPLWTTASNGTTWSLDSTDNVDLQFLNLMCDGVIVDHQWVNNSVYVSNYSCSGVTTETVRVLTGGVHTRQFVYGNDVGYAKNFATNRNSGFLAYSEGVVTSPRYRIYDPGTNSWGAEQTALSVGQSIEEIQVACSPARFECAILTVDSGDDVEIQFWDGNCWSDGTTCGSTYSLDTATNTLIEQRAQLMYEEISGDLLVVWAGNAVDLIEYRVWNGSTWSVLGDVNSDTATSIPTGGEPEWLELESEPGTDNISIAWKDSGDDVSAAVYNGNSDSFGCEWTGTIANTDTSSRQDIDIEYEQVSGDMFLVGGMSSTTEFRYVTRASGSCTYSGPTQTTDMAEESDAITIAAAYGYDDIVGAVKADTGNDMDTFYWDGSSETSGARDTTTEGEANGNRQIGGECSRDSTDDLCVMLYADNNNVNLRYFSYVPSTNSLSGPNTFTPSPTFASNSLDTIECVANPVDSDSLSEIMCIMKDNQQDIFAKIFDASTATWSDTEGGAALEINSNSPSGYKTHSFAYIGFNNPYYPSVNSPANASIDQAVYLNLSVNIVDPNLDVMNVSLYWSNGTLMETFTNQASDSNVTHQTSKLDYLTTYNWYAVATDGTYTTISPTWEFTTKDRDGVLSVVLNTPSTVGVTNVLNTKKTTVNATISCIGILDETCDRAYAAVRYNNSASTMANVTNTSFSQPLWINGSNPQFCDLAQGESCSLAWDLWVNATDYDILLVDVNAISNFSAVNIGNDGNATLNVTPPPPPSVIWNKASIDFGSVDLNSIDPTDAAKVLSVDVQSNVQVFCASGDCARFTDDFTDGSNMNDGDEITITFTCLDDTVGTFNALYQVNSTQDTSPDNLTLDCQVNQTYGTIGMNYVNPLLSSITNISKYDRLDLNVTLFCSGTLGAFCGNVDATVRTSYHTDDFPYRIALEMDETKNLARTNDVIQINFTGLDSQEIKIDNCIDDTRIYSNETGSYVEIPSQLISGDNSSWCEFLFLGNLSANAINEISYFFYYGYDAGTPSYTSPISSTDDLSGWNINNGLIQWNYSWTGGRSNGPWRSALYTPAGSIVSSSGPNAQGDDSFQNADAFTSFTTVVDGPLYKEFELVSATRGTGTYRVYAYQNWFEIEMTHSCSSGCNDFHIIGNEGTDSTGQWYEGFPAATNTNNRNSVSGDYLMTNGGGTSWSVGAVFDGSSPFSTERWATGWDGWGTNNVAISASIPYRIFSTDDGTNGANWTVIEYQNPISETTTQVLENNSAFKVMATTSDSPMYTTSSQPQTCTSLTVGGANCSIKWTILPIGPQAPYELDVNASSSLGQVSDFDSANIAVWLMWPDVFLNTPLNGTITNSYTNYFSANISDWYGLVNASLHVWNSTGDLIGTNSTTMSGLFEFVNRSFTVSSDDTYYWNYLSYDAQGFAFNSTNYTLYIDTTPPVVNLTLSTNGSSSTDNPQYFLGNFSDSVSGLQNATLYLWNSTGSLVGTNGTSLSGNTGSSNLSLVPPYEGTFHWNYLVYDLANNSVFNATNYTLYWDGTAPVVNLTLPSNGTNAVISLNDFIGNFSDLGTGLKNATLMIWNFTGGLIGYNSSSVSGFSDGVNLSYDLPSEGSYYWNYYVYDIAGNLGFNSTNFTRLYDVTVPVVNLSLPNNDSYVSTYINTFEGSFSDYGTGLKNATLYVWNSSGGLIGTNSTNLSGFVTLIDLNLSVAYDDFYVWNYIVYDVVGNSVFNSTNFTLNVDTNAPIVNLTFPQNGIMVNYSLINFVSNYTEQLGGGLKNATLYVWNSTGDLIGTNSSISSGLVNSSNFSLDVGYEDVFTWNYLVYDHVNLSSWNATNFTIYVDWTPPIIDLISPSNRTATNLAYNNFTVNLTDDVTGLKNATLYVWNSTGDLMGINSTNFTGYQLSNLTILGFNFTQSGIFYWNYLVYDNISNSAWANGNFTYVIDTIKPVITFVAPSDADNSFVNRSWTEINATVTDNSNSSGFIDFDGSVLGYWNFDNVSGSTIYDWSEYKNNGTLSAGAQVASTDVIRGDYLSLNGSNYIELGQPSELNFTGFENFTVSAWVNVAGGTGLQRPIICKGDNQYCLKILPTDKAEFCVYDSTWRCATSTLSLNVGEWYSVVGKVQGTEISLWVDGSQEITTGTLVSGISSSTDNVNIGRDASIPTRLFNGSIDEVMIFNRSLDSSEIKALYNSDLNTITGNYSLYKNGEYNYSACAMDNYGNFDCTARTINFNKTLPQITITNPLNGTQFSYFDLIDFNVSTLMDAYEVWVEFDSNGTRYNLTNISDLKTWGISNLGTFNSYTRNMVFYANDIEGNEVNKSGWFWIIPEFFVDSEKTIESSGNDDSYKVTINISNVGVSKNYTLYDLVSDNFTAYNFSPNFNGTSPVSGGYSGDLYKWNFTMVQGESRSFSYFVNGSGDYYFGNMFLMFGVE